MKYSLIVVGALIGIIVVLRCIRNYARQAYKRGARDHIGKPAVFTDEQIGPHIFLYIPALFN